MTSRLSTVPGPHWLKRWQQKHANEETFFVHDDVYKHVFRKQKTFNHHVFCIYSLDQPSNKLHPQDFHLTVNHSLWPQLEKSITLFLLLFTRLYSQANLQEWHHALRGYFVPIELSVEWGACWPCHIFLSLPLSGTSLDLNSDIWSFRWQTQVGEGASLILSNILTYIQTYWHLVSSGLY